MSYSLNTYKQCTSKCMIILKFDKKKEKRKKIVIKHAIAYRHKFDRIRDKSRGTTLHVTT